MKAPTLAFCSLLAMLAAILVIGLGLLHNALFEGALAAFALVGAAIWMFNKAEDMMVEEAIGRRLYRGEF